MTHEGETIEISLEETWKLGKKNAELTVRTINRGARGESASTAVYHPVK